MKYILLFIFLWPNAHFSTSLSISHQQLFKVKKVVDGDTFWVEDGSKKGMKIRLIGVDAPESRNAFRKKKEPFGEASKQYLINLIDGKRVRLKYDVSRYDRYGRTLAYAWLEDGTFINAKLLQDGYAVVMTVPPNIKYADYFLKLQRKARRANRGLWKN